MPPASSASAGICAPHVARGGDLGVARHGADRDLAAGRADALEAREPAEIDHGAGCDSRCFITGMSVWPPAR